MEPISPWSLERLYRNTPEQDRDWKQFVISQTPGIRKIYQNFIAALDTIKIVNVRMKVVTMNTSNNSQVNEITEDKLTNIDEQQEVTDGQEAREMDLETEPVSSDSDEASIAKGDTGKVAVPETPIPEELARTLDDQKGRTPITMHDTDTEEIDAPTVAPPPLASPFHTPQAGIKRGTAVLLIALLAIVALQGLTFGPTQFLGAQGWASVLGNPVSQSDPNLLANIGKQIRQRPVTVKPGVTATVKAQMTPSQYIDLIVNKMTLDQKLGQMMIVQFTGPTYSLPISTMISQYNVGAVLVFTANGNVVDQSQLKGLIQQMKSGSATIPLAVAIDQEGGTVDRLINLDGPRPEAATIGATNDPAQARQDGMIDAKDLASYGFNLNLAPVVDVTNVYNAQMYGRTFGDTPQQVTKMAGAYLQGLQQSGKVIGTLKHFPGLGDVSTDPHLSIPVLTRSKSDLEKIDWAPYRALIRSGNVHAIMVTHELVEAIDGTEPSSLSPKLIQGILRDDLGFQGVVMTDSLTMDALSAYATMPQAAVLSIEAGADLLMGAASPDDVAAMFQSIKQAMSSGAITQQRINESVYRILMMKYAMGLLPIPKN
jgi:beta-N-acetylhexosaminidase